MQRVFSALLVGFFFLISFTYFSDDFFSFHQEQVGNSVKVTQLGQDLRDFSLNDIEEISGIELRFTPGIQHIDFIISLVNAAKSTVYLNIYMFTEKRIRQSMIDAALRGVDVRVILEKNVYKTPNINQNSFDLLTKAGVKVVWSSSDDYDLNHAKYMMVDNTWMISTGNFTYSTFTKNKDIFVFGKEKKVFGVLEKTFLGDFVGKSEIVYANNIIMAPFYARHKLEYLIQNAQVSMDLYMPYIDDEALKKLLRKSLLQGIKIRIITGNFDVADSFFDDMKKGGAQVVFSSKTIHAKAFLVDSKILAISSINYSSSSIDTNKEIGVILQGEKIVKNFVTIFESDL